MSHFLITQIHDEDGSIEQEIYEADTWQVAMAMAQLGWALDGATTPSLAATACRAEGTTVMIGVVEAYQDYKGETKIQLKAAV